MPVIRVLFEKADRPPLHETASSLYALAQLGELATVVVEAADAETTPKLDVLTDFL